MDETKIIPRTIRISDEQCEVTAHKTKATWKAVGNYRGMRIEGQGARTFEEAFAFWKNKAKMEADKIG